MLGRIKRLLKGEPDFTIHRGEGVYMRRWYVIPRNRFFNIYLHHFLQSDDPRALHDHPWWNVSIVLKGGYWEIVPVVTPRNTDLEAWARPSAKTFFSDVGRAHIASYFLRTRRVYRRPGTIKARGALDAHRVELLWDGIDSQGKPKERSCWSLFITGPNRRVWGFWLPDGWAPFTDMVEMTPDGRGNKQKALP